VGPEAPVLIARGRAAVVGDLLTVARPRQWTKNLVCLAGLVFAGRAGDPASVRLALLTFAAFCLASSTVYVVNDLCDRELDRAHPRKRLRPIAAGRLEPGPALVEALALAAGAFALAWLLPVRARWVLTVFLALNFVYSFGLKRIAILDVMAIALGFVLRVQAGIEALAAPQSAWIVLCMFFVALFLGFGKRRSELAMLAAETGFRQRPALGGYSLGLLDVLLAISGTTALVCYSLYAVNVQGSVAFLLTVLPVVFGILRYLMVVLEAGGEDPDELLTRDLPLVTAIVVWGALCVAVLYVAPSFLP
jgi:4-hydroxybenzoate polyprenyltransferase